MPIQGKLFDRFGPRPLAIAGIVMLIFTSWIYHYLTLATATSTIILWTMLRGFVMPLANMPAQTAALVEIPNELVGRASSLTNIFGRVAGSFGIAVLTTVLNTRQVLHGSWLAWSVNPSNAAAIGALARASEMMGGGAKAHRMALTFLQGMVTQTAFVDAIDDVFLITAIVTVVAVIPAFFLRKRRAGAVRKEAVAE
jgi:MFS family permease